MFCERAVIRWFALGVFMPCFAVCALMLCFRMDALRWCFAGGR